MQIIVMRTVSLLLVVMAFASCSESSKDPLASSDSLAIQFKSIESGSIVKTIGTNDVKAIRKITNFLEGTPVENYKCGYDGQLLFYKNGSLTRDVSFNYSTGDCRHFLRAAGDSLKATRMSDEAASFLKSLAEGNNWY